MINGDKMNNAELIITLTLIKGLGRKTINKIIRQGVLNSLETIETIDYLNRVTLPAGTVNRLCGLLASTVTMNGSHWNTSLGMVVSTTRYCP